LVCPTVFPDPEALGDAVARRIADGIAAANRSGRRYVLGCPGGRSPMTTYAALAQLVRERSLDLSGLVIVMMDDYVEQAREAHNGSGGFVAISDDLAHSCGRFAREVIARPLSLAAGSGRGVRPEHIWLPDPADPAAYDDRLAAVGGVDLFLLATGASDGHVGFNPPGTPVTSGTRIVELAESTRRDNLATFPHLASLADVPRHGVTVGIDTIRRHSASVAMLAHGPDKAESVRRLLCATGYDESWPATVICECRDAALYVDQAAMSEVGVGADDLAHGVADGVAGSGVAPPDGDEER